jgi:hypothetical protein
MNFWGISGFETVTSVQDQDVNLQPSKTLERLLLFPLKILFQVKLLVLEYKLHRVPMRFYFL